jgi:hypothetical protein
MRRIAFLCPITLGALTGLPGCLEAQHGGQGGDAQTTSEPLATTPPPDTSATAAPPDTSATATAAPPDTATPDSEAPPDTTTASNPPDTATPDSEVPPDTTPQCQAADAECENGRTCCPGLTCLWQPDHYMLALCQPRRADGAPCMEDDACLSGHCVDGLCGQVPACANEGTVCSMQGDCCASLVCTGGPYVYGECIQKQPLHAYCEDDRWCSSGLCADGACASPGCVENGTTCTGSECCSGLCLFPTDRYGPAVCTAPLPPGAWCEGHAMCASGTCADGVCAAPSCAPRGDTCWSDGACCADSFCTQWGQSYTVGYCVGKRGEGGDCMFDSWCRSGHCVDALCVTAP